MTAERLHLNHQPDDPGPHPGVCPTCGCRCSSSEEIVARKLLKANAGRVHKAVIARALSWSVAKLERFARECDPPFNLELPKEPEPRGA